MTPQRVTLITLGVSDLERSRKFYAALGWEPVPGPPQVIFYRLDGMALGLFGVNALADDQGRPGAQLGTGAMTLAQNFATEAEGDAAVEAALLDHEWTRCHQHRQLGVAGHVAHVPFGDLVLAREDVVVAGVVAGDRADPVGEVGRADGQRVFAD